MSWTKIPRKISKHLYQYEAYEAIPESKFSEIRTRCERIHRREPLVSVVAIAHNEEKNILRCISSLSEQNTNVPYELIIVDNNSEDKTGKIIERCGAVHVFEQKKGPGHARQAGLDAARGKYMLTADGDSVYPPTYVEGMLRYLQKQGVTGVFGRFSFLSDSASQRFKFKLYEAFRDLVVKLRSIKRPELSVGGACFGMVAKVARKYGYRTDIRRGEDGSMVSALKKHGRVVSVNDPGVRVWTSNDTVLSDGGFLRIIAKKLGRELNRLHEYFSTKKGEYKTLERNRL